MARQTPDRRGDTTSALLLAAGDELVEVGQGDFAMESVARRAFFSVGTVYERWPDRESLIADVAGTRLTRSIRERFSSVASVDDALRIVLNDEDRLLTLLGECILATRSMPAVSVPAGQAYAELRLGLQRWMGPGMAWYLSTVGLGGALIALMGVTVRDPAGSPVFADACAAETENAEAGESGGVLVTGSELPQVPQPSRSDDVALSLMEAARLVLAERGAGAAHAREIASRAGVTTGALYRRYEGKSRLIADVLLLQLKPDRYAWTWELIEAFDHPDPYSTAAGVLTDRIEIMASDREGQEVLLQIGVAARNDEALRAEVGRRIWAALDARRGMIEQFADVGLVRPDVPPAVLAWGFQALPVGIRATLPLLGDLDGAEVKDSMRAMLVAVSPPTKAT